MISSFTYRKEIALFLLSFGLLISCGARADVLLTDDFESYAVGTWPSPNWLQVWNASDLANNGIRSDATDANNKVLKLYGVEDNSAAAIRSVGILPAAFTIEARIYNGSEPRRVGWGRGSIALWQGRTFFTFDSDGNLHAGGSGGLVLAAYQTERWYDVKVDYLRQGSNVSLTYWLDGTYLSQLSDTVGNDISADHIVLDAGSSAYFDNIRITQSQQTGASQGKILVLTSTNIKATDITGATTYWTWPYPQTASSATAQVVPDGEGGYRVLVATQVGGSPTIPTTYCLSAADGLLKWQVDGYPADGHENSVLTHNIYTDTDLFSNGYPKVGDSAAPDILISHRNFQFGGTTSQIFCINAGSGHTNWTYATAGDHWASGWIPDVNGDGIYDFVVRSAIDHGTTGLSCISGKDGSTQIWFRPDVSRGGVTVGDVTGDGKADYAVAECCYQDVVYMLSGSNGNNVWPSESYGSFDVLGDKRMPGTSDFLVAAQLSSDGGIRRYAGIDGHVVWTCPATYNDQTLQGLIPIPGGYYALSGWRHQNLTVCVDASSGAKIWDNVPASDHDHVGIVVPDQDADGYNDLLIVNNGTVTLYSTRTGNPISGFAQSNVLELAYLPGVVDSDGDGVPDSLDQCPNTPPGSVVDSNGCSVAQLVPCGGPLSGGAWKNHGEYLFTVIKTATDFLKANLISRREWAVIVSRAARSKCGWNRRSDRDGDRNWNRDWDWDHDRGWNRGVSG